MRVVVGSRLFGTETLSLSRFAAINSRLSFPSFYIIPSSFLYRYFTAIHGPDDKDDELLGYSRPTQHNTTQESQRKCYPQVVHQGGVPERWGRLRAPRPDVHHHCLVSHARTVLVLESSDSIVNARSTQYIAAAAIHTTLHSRSALGLPPSIPIATLSSGRLRLRYLNTETQRSTPSSAPPPIPSSSSNSGKPAVSASQHKLATTPMSTAPPTPPLPIDSIPPKIVDVAAEKVEKEMAVKKEEKVKGTVVSRAWAVVKKEASHYWHGTKLLGQEIKISAKLQWKVLQGSTLTRRERRQVSHQLVHDVKTELTESSFVEQPVIYSV